MYGYPNTRALKWGMSGWNPATSGPWNNKTGNVAQGSTNWTYSSAPSANVFKDPTLSNLSQDGSEILRQRIEAVVAAGFKTASNGDVMASPSNYFINNYFSVADFNDFGHIVDAYRIFGEDLTLKTNGYLGMDPDANAKVVSYCYTGQTSAVLTAWLNVLGYDAYSLTFGMNGLYHSNTGWDKNPKTNGV